MIAATRQLTGLLICFEFSLRFRYWCWCRPLDFGTATDGGTTPVTPTEDTSTLEVGTDRPSGAAGPTSTNGILRFEARTGNGGGLVSDVSYNAVDDTFLVDNLGFDGENIYTRGDAATAVASLNGYSVFEAELTTPDSLTGVPINQISPYRAILGISKNDAGSEARTSFAIVRTGGYINYGFGGFVYERNGGATVPTTGQAQFRGDYAGIRVFQNRGGLEYTTGNMTMEIDFNDFNANDAVKGSITNRALFDSSGNEITLSDSTTQLPNMGFVIQEGSPSLTENGEISGSLFSSTVNTDGNRENYETGTYYGILAGDATDAGDGGEIVGVFVVESTDPRYQTTVQETGGFILYR